jgi:hypothetical protein
MRFRIKLSSWKDRATVVLAPKSPRDFPAPYFLKTARIGFRGWTLEDLPLALGPWGDPRVMGLIDARGRLSEDQVKERLLREMAALDLSGTLVNNQGLKEVGTLKSLKILNLRFTPITDHGLKHLAALKKLRKLIIGSNDHITDIGLKALALLQELRELHVNWTQVTDAGLANLVTLKNLNGLNLEGLRVTDKGLQKLTVLRKLKGINARGTQVTARGAAKVQKVRRRCEVILKDEDRD